jgi:hypothetical protein
MKLTRTSQPKALGITIILSIWIVSFLLLVVVFLEIYFQMADKKHELNALHKTSYYGKALDDDPYSRFVVQHLHPYYLFSLPWKHLDKINANNPFVNIDKVGFRVNSYESLSNVVLLGGSTAFGHFSSSDKTTIASTLSSAMKVRVVNRNAPSWNSHQELIALAKYGDTYDYSISFSTANDISIFCGDELWNETFSDRMENFGTLESYFNDITKTPSFLKSLREYLSSRFPGTALTYFRLKQIFVGDSVISAVDSQYCGGVGSAKKVASNILQNQKTMQLLTEARGGKHFLIIQPWYPMHLKADDETKNKYREEITFHNMVVSTILKDNFCRLSCLNLSKIFDDYTPLVKTAPKSLIYIGTNESSKTAVFIDSVHLSDTGVKVVTQKIVNFLKN